MAANTTQSYHSRVGRPDMASAEAIANGKSDTIRDGLSPDCKVHGANMGPIWGRQDPGGPHAGPMNLAIWVIQPNSTAPFIFMTKFLCNVQSWYCERVKGIPVRGPFYKHGLHWIPTWIINHMSSKVWDEIIYPFPNFNSCIVEVGNGKGISPHTMLPLIIYLCWD